MVPEKQSYPPRKLIIVAGTLLVVVLAAIWLFVTMVWQGSDPEDPRRIQAQALLERFAPGLSRYRRAKSSAIQVSLTASETVVRLRKVQNCEFSDAGTRVRLRVESDLVAPFAKLRVACISLGTE